MVASEFYSVSRNCTVSISPRLHCMLSNVQRIPAGGGPPRAGPPLPVARVRAAAVGIRQRQLPRAGAFGLVHARPATTTTLVTIHERAGRRLHSGLRAHTGAPAAGGACSAFGAHGASPRWLLHCVSCFHVTQLSECASVHFIKMLFKAKGYCRGH